jgi:3-oxoacyl-[acyl-carrier-protein] synthase III
VSSPELVGSPALQPPSIAHVQLSGLGSYLPERSVGNEEIAARAGVDEAWILKRTGIHTRRHADPDSELVDLAEHAARAAIKDADLDAADIDLVLLATVSQGRPMPNVAPQLASRIGAVKAGAFDLGAACSGFIGTLATATAFIESGRAGHVLLVGADVLSRQTDPTDRKTAALFGDGAAAAVLAATEHGEQWTIELGADGEAAGLIQNDRDTGLILMNGHDTFLHALDRMEQVTRSVCARGGVAIEDVDLFVFHQANARITRSLGQRLGLDPHRVVDCIAEHGNTSAASVPLALTHARTHGRLADREKIVLCAVGAGLIWGAALIEWGTQ